ncbi:MAG: hypothetical protein KKA62_03980 [Nanoarchaeota archaeon]|nr:hypothetical protein [Nanoarchaeota archaeon]MBU1977082.1 hypothetical protein [Nanoarchaeota archaeon]
MKYVPLVSISAEPKYPGIGFWCGDGILVTFMQMIKEADNIVYGGVHITEIEKEFEIHGIVKIKKCMKAKKEQI